MLSLDTVSLMWEEVDLETKRVSVKCSHLYDILAVSEQKRVVLVSYEKHLFWFLNRMSAHEKSNCTRHNDKTKL